MKRISKELVIRLHEMLIKLGLEVASGEMSKENFKSFIENKIIK